MCSTSPSPPAERLQDLEKQVARLREENARLRGEGAGPDHDTIDYRRMVEGLPGVAYQFRMTTDGAYHFRYISEKCIGLFGYTVREIVADASRVFRLLPPEDAKRVETAIAASARSLRPYSVEHRVVRPDGETVWVHASSIPRKLPGGEIRWDGFALDISERKETEAALKESEEKFRLAFNTSPDAINLNRLSDGRYLDINEGFTRIMGHTRQDAIGKTSLELNIWDDPADRERLVAALRETGYVQNLEARFRAKDGTVRYGLMSARVLPINDEAVILSITRDITDRKRDEETIQSRILALTRPDIQVGDVRLTDILGLDMLQELQDAFSDASGVPTMIYDNSGRLITRTSNPTGFCRLVRSTPEGSRRCEAFDARLIEELSQNPRPVVRKGCVARRIITGTAPIVIGDLHVANIGMGQMTEGDLDMDEIRRFAREIGIPPEDLAAAADTLIPFDPDRFDKTLAFLNTLARQLALMGLQNLQQARFIHERDQATKGLHHAQRMESIGMLAGGIAHDFNNILFPIMGYVEMLLEDAPAESWGRGALEKILDGTTRARELVKQILTFSRQTGEEVQPVRMQLILKEAMKLVRSTLPSTIAVRHRIDENCKAVMADPTQIHQVVMNLITNAYHAMQETGGELLIGLTTVEPPAAAELSSLPPGRYACLTVSDTGPGIPADIRDRIFDPYYTTQPQDKGTGLGLSVVHGIVKSCGGGIHVHSQPGAGATFKVYLPLKETAPDAQAAPAHADIPGGTERLLIVDDESAVVSIVQAMLERLGYRITSCTDSGAALETFRQTPEAFDLVITDMTMPELTGPQLTRRLREIRPDVKVIICTGFSDLMNEEKAAALGIQGYILKPVIKGEIALKVREVLDGP